MVRFTSLLAVGLAAWGVPAPAADGPDRVVSVESLLDRMIHLRWLAEPPEAGERTVQFSSYDRASRLEGGEIVNPFANADRGHYLRVEETPAGREYVLAEAEGPGYVSRIWSANPAGELRIYIDGAAEPTLAADFARITNGEIAPFTAPFGHEASRGRNLYFPFPFARSIKITTTEGDQYFQVAVTHLPAGTSVESYTPVVLERASDTIETTRSALLAPFDAPVEGQEVSRTTTIAPGQAADLVEPIEGSGAIARLQIRIQAANPEAALARSLLTIGFDDAETPQVAVPVGEFFGSGPGINPFQTAVSQVAEDGTMTARWYMPYRQRARIRLANGAEHPILVHCAAVLDDRPPGAEALMFHVRWRQGDDIETVGGDGTRDWPALRVEGAPGRFVGLLLNVFNPTTAWWGEGDEKVYVDGEAFPSTFGTGTEDYFGYAWCDPNLYMNPFHAQTRCDGPGNRGNTSNVRYQLLDAIPWRSSIAFDLEIWHWEPVTIQYGTLAYFYAGPEATVEPGVPDLAGRVVHPADEGIHREPGVIEGETLRIESVTGGDALVQGVLGFGEAWSGGEHLWWICRSEGGSLTLALPVKEAGTYALSAALTKAPDYGIATLAIDGKPLGDGPINLYAPQVVHSGPIALGHVPLEAGTRKLGVTMTAKDPRSTSYMFGLDWIKLERVPD